MLEPKVRELAEGANFAALTTLMPGGQPQTQIMWIDCDGDHLCFNTEVHRQKFRNIRRDPRVTVTIWDCASPYRYVEVRGRVEQVERGPAARRHVDQLSLKYNGRPFAAAGIRSERVIVRVRPERQRVYGDG